MANLARPPIRMAFSIRRAQIYMITITMYFTMTFFDYKSAEGSLIDLSILSITYYVVP